MPDERPPRRRALLLENIHPGAAERLEEAGFEVSTWRGSLSENELADRVSEVDILGIRSRTRVTEAILDKTQGPGRHRGVLHRDQSDRRGRRGEEGHRRFQRPLLEHPQRGRAGHRRDRSP